MVHNSRFKGNLRYVYEEMEKRDEKYRFVIISKKELLTIKKKGILNKLIERIKKIGYFMFILNYHLATAEYVFLNDNFLPMAHMHFSKKAKVVQLWHGAGAFKRFGLSTEEDSHVRNYVEKGNKKITHLFVTSKNVVDIYKEAIGISEDKIYPIGIPVTDYYSNEDKISKARYEVEKKYPELKNKKVILYTPTFRTDVNENMKILEKFDFEKISKELGDEYKILIRLHPQFPVKIDNISENCIDVTEYDDIKQLFIRADILVTDYSSVVVEYALLNKPMIFYAYDLEHYDRGFYLPYRDNVPGKVVTKLDDLIEMIRKEDFSMERIEPFLKYQYDILDGKASKRVVDIVTNKVTNWRK